jgi:hypothetical protein
MNQLVTSWEEFETARGFANLTDWLRCEGRPQMIRAEILDVITRFPVSQQPQRFFAWVAAMMSQLSTTTPSVEPVVSEFVEVLTAFTEIKVSA